MAPIIKKLSVNKETPFTRRILVSSEPGVGKTHLCGTAQDCAGMADVLICDLDGGSSTLLSRGDMAGVQARTVAEVEQVLWLIANRDKSVATIKTVVLDGLSELSRKELADIANDAAKTNSKRDANANELRDYMLVKNRMLRILRMARDLPVNVVITTWVKKIFPMKPGTLQADTTQQPTAIVPDISESLRPTLMGLVDDAWTYVYDDKTGRRYLYTANLGPVSSKTRDSAVAAQMTTEIDGKVLPVIVDPTFPEIFARYAKAYGV
mgnify:FL=1